VLFAKHQLQLIILNFTDMHNLMMHFSVGLNNGSLWIKTYSLLHKLDT